MPTFRIILLVLFAVLVGGAIVKCTSELSSERDRLYADVHDCEVIGDAWIAGTRGVELIHFIYRCPDGAIRIRPQPRD